MHEGPYIVAPLLCTKRGENARHFRAWRRERRRRALTGSCRSAEQTALRTETTSVLLVKWARPSSPLSCCIPITMAAPPMNPTMAACDRKSTRNPSLGRRDEPTTCTGKKQDHTHVHQSRRRVGAEQSTCFIRRNTPANQADRTYLKRPKETWKTPARKVTVKTSDL